MSLNDQDSFFYLCIVLVQPRKTGKCLDMTEKLLTGIKASTQTCERSGSVVECLTRDRRAAGWSLTGVTALCP